MDELDGTRLYLPTDDIPTAEDELAAQWLRRRRTGESEDEAPPETGN